MEKKKTKKPVFYAVAVGIKVGIFESWDEVAPLVNGYPGAIHQKFSSLDQAQAFLSGAKPGLQPDFINAIDSQGKHIIYRKEGVPGEAPKPSFTLCGIKKMESEAQDTKVLTIQVPQCPSINTEIQPALIPSQGASWDQNPISGFKLPLKIKTELKDSESTVAEHAPMSLGWILPDLIPIDSLAQFHYVAAIDMRYPAWQNHCFIRAIALFLTLRTNATALISETDLRNHLLQEYPILSDSTRNSIRAEVKLSSFNIQEISTILGLTFVFCNNDSQDCITITPLLPNPDSFLPVHSTVFLLYEEAKQHVRLMVNQKDLILIRSFIQENAYTAVGTGFTLALYATPLPLHGIGGLHNEIMVGSSNDIPILSLQSMMTNGEGYEQLLPWNDQDGLIEPLNASEALAAIPIDQDITQTLSDVQGILGNTPHHLVDDNQRIYTGEGPPITLPKKF